MPWHPSQEGACPAAHPCGGARVWRARVIQGHEPPPTVGVTASHPEETGMLRRLARFSFRHRRRLDTTEQRFTHLERTRR
jgi:hypothetical protein